MSTAIWTVVRWYAAKKSLHVRGVGRPEPRDPEPVLESRAFTATRSRNTSGALATVMTVIAIADCSEACIGAWRRMSGHIPTPSRRRRRARTRPCYSVPARSLSFASVVSASSGVRRLMSSATQHVERGLRRGEPGASTSPRRRARAGPCSCASWPRVRCRPSGVTRSSRALRGRLRSREDVLGQAGETRAGDAVAARGGAALHLVEEDDRPRVLARAHAEVLRARRALRELGELVVMRREERVRQPTTSWRCSATAHAIESPSYVLVPRRSRRGRRATGAWRAS